MGVGAAIRSQVPTAEVVEEHSSPDGQPLPPVPRHPCTQALASHTKPLLAPPQSASVEHLPLHLPPEQTADLHSLANVQGLSSTLPQVPFSQTLERHTVAAAHGPLFCNPHASSMLSHTPAAHTRAPTAAVHLLPTDVGTGAPFASLGLQTPAVVVLPPSHQLPLAQSVSVLQPVVQAPLATSHLRPAWFGPPLAVMQSASAVHLPQLPTLVAPGLVTQ